MYYSLTIQRYNRKRHRHYACAFSSSILLKNYLKLISRFVNDKSLSPDNEEDLDLFRDLIFHTRWQKNHIYYYCWVLNNSRNTKLLAKYSAYLDKLADFFVDDLFHYLCREESCRLIQAYFNKLPQELKFKFLRVASQHPHVLKNIPKFKLYMIFS